MRHPSPTHYLLAFGIPLFAGVVCGIRVRSMRTDEASTAMLIVKTAAVVLFPLVSILAVMAVFTGIMLYLGVFRAGNRVRVTGGEYAGNFAVVSRYHGMTTNGWVHVRLEPDGREVTVSPYQCQKVGWRSHVF